MSKTAHLPAQQSQQKMTVYQARDGQKIELTLEIVRDFLVTGKKELVRVQELVYFIGVCKARGLNPFAKDCYLIKYTENEPAAIITAIDFYRSRARAQKDCVGWEKGVICRSKKEGTLRYSKGLVLEEEVVVGGWFKSQPTSWTVPFEIEVNLGEFQKKTKEGNITKFWQNSAMMIAKVAESQGLRTLWPDEFRGTITAEEAGLQVEQFETIEMGTLPGGGQGVQEAPPKLDTSAFDKLIAEKNLDATRLEHLKVNLELMATNQKKTVDEIKVAIAPMFNAIQGDKKKGYWSHFLAWEKQNYPAEGQASAVQEPPEPAGDAPESTEKTPEPQGQGPEQDPGNDWPDAATEEPKVVSFADRQMKVWHDVVGKGIGLDKLAQVQVQRLEDINPENIDALEKLVNDFQPPKARGRGR